MMTHPSRILAVAYAIVACSSQLPAGTVRLEGKSLAVEVDDSFPRMIRYTLKPGGAGIAGQAEASGTVALNGKVEPCTVKFTKRGPATADYQLGFAGPRVDVVLRVTVVADAVDIRIAGVKEHGAVKLMTLGFPGSCLLSVSSADAGAELGAVSASGYANSKEILGPLAGLPADGKDATGNHLFLSNGKVAAGIATNHLRDVNRVGWKISASGEDKLATAWMPIWQYREQENEVLPQPFAKIILTGDINGDGSANWQDACLVHRKIMPKPLGADLVKTGVADQIAMDFASMAQQPFLRILDGIKKAYLLTDGLGHNVTVKGFTAEGHDSANTDYGGHYNARAGGLKDLNFLLGNAGKYNARVGVHINATEVYPEAHRYKREILDLDGNGNPKGGWAWLDASHLIDKRKDVLSGQLFASLDLMRRDLPSLRFIYLDVYGESGWTGWMTAAKINALGLPLHTEYSTALDPWTTWAHLRKIDGRIYRFLWNAERDLFAPDPLLRGADHIGFMGWQGERSIPGFLQNTFGKNLPTKFLQHFELLRWDPGKEAVFSGGVKVVKDGDAVTCTRDGRVVMTWTGNGSNNRLFVPWDPVKEAKIYVWDESGEERAWELPPAWKSKSEVFLYRLSDLGRCEESRLAVHDGKVTVKVTKATPYVIYPAKAPAAQQMVWGEGGLVKDPGFDSMGFTAWNPVPVEAVGQALAIKPMQTGDARLVISGPSATLIGVRQKLTGLEPGKTYAASVWVQITGNREARIVVEAAGMKTPVMNAVTVTKVANRNDSDAKIGTYFQRMKVVFTQPAGTTTAELSLQAMPDAAGATVEFDDVRVVRTERAVAAAGHAYYEDFENVDQGWGPFVYASPGQTQTHLSETNPGVTDDTIEGKYSFKTFNEPAGMVVRSLPSHLQMKAATRYRLTVDTLADSAIYKLVVQGKAGNPATIRMEKPIAQGKGQVSAEFSTARTDESFLALIKSDKGGGKCVLDRITLDKLGPVPAAEVEEMDDGDMPVGAKSVVDVAIPAALDGAWSVTKSSHHGTTVAVDNGVLKITAAANVSAVATCKLPEGSLGAECTLRYDGAAGETWGPGLTLLWHDGQAVRINIRGPENRFGIDSSVAAQSMVGKVARGEEVALRICVCGDKVLGQVRSAQAEGEWQTLVEFDAAKFPGLPDRVQLGKSHGVEGLDDNAAAGEPGNATFRGLKAFRK